MCNLILILFFHPTTLFARVFESCLSPSVCLYVLFFFPGGTADEGHFNWYKGRPILKRILVELELAKHQTTYWNMHTSSYCQLELDVSTH